MNTCILVGYGCDEDRFWYAVDDWDVVPKLNTQQTLTIGDNKFIGTVKDVSKHEFGNAENPYTVWRILLQIGTT